jgi:rRNA processing protein Krr1/Pno1
VEKVFTPISVLPFIIGKKGVTLKNIQDLSGANIKVPTKREDNETTSVAADEDVEEETVEVLIEGVDSAVAKAKEELYKIINEKVFSPVIVLMVDFEEDGEIG